jgi:hypothetical protein
MKVNNRDKRRRKRLGYDEWRKREIERLVIYSGASGPEKLRMLESLRDEGFSKPAP